jgi:hypothetical protein
VLTSFCISFISGFFRLVKDRYLSETKALQIVAFTLNLVIKLIVMFLVMSMSGWACIAIILGASFGEVALDVLEQWKKREFNDRSRESHISE